MSPSSPQRLLIADRGVARALGASVGASVAGLLCTIAWLLLLTAVIDRVFVAGDDRGDVTASLVAMVGLLFLRGALAWAAEVSAVRASGRLRAGVRDRLVAHLFAVGPAGLDREHTGEVAATIGTGVDALHDYTTRFVPAAALAVIGPLIVFVAIGVLDPWTLLILAFAGPMLVLLLAVIGGRTQALTRRRFDELGWLSAFYLDMIRGLGTLKAFGRSREGADTIEGVSRRFGDTTMEVLRTAFQTSLVMEWAATAATALVAVQVSFRLIGGHVSFGVALAVLVLTPEFFVPFRRLAIEYHAGQAGRAALTRIDELLTLPVHTVVVRATAAPSLVTAPLVQFEAVSFTYPASAQPAVRILDLRLDPCETVALVGASGAGKTTVARLLLRFVEPSSGRLLVDGRDLATIDAAQWRGSLAWVPQDPTLISGTVADNIRLGDPGASIERVCAAAELARADGFIAALPDGFDTVLGERGLRLSGGQRQRLAIARAALRDAPLVVLDEFTAHLDQQVEADILAAVGDLLRGRTALVIAHRERTIAAADRVVTLGAGTVLGEHVPARPGERT